MNSLKNILFLLIQVLIVLVFFACGGGETVENIVSDSNQVAISLVAESNIELEQDSWDSIVVNVSGEGLSDLHIVDSNFTDDYIAIDNLAPGNARLFEVLVYKDGLKLYSGSVTSDLGEGEVVDLEVILKPQTANFTIRIPIGISNPKDISDGSVSLTGDNLSITKGFEVQGNEAVFEFTEIYFGIYDVDLILLNSVGDSIYSYSNQIILDENSDDYYSLELESLLTGAVLSLEIEFSPNDNYYVNYPNVKVRSPKSFSEIIFTEILANPKTSGDDFEFIEIYNASLDSLKLDGCELLKDKGSTTTTTKLSLNGFELIIPPSQYMILGRDSVDFANANYSGFTLTNSGQSLFMVCDDIIIDSLIFSDSNDDENSFPMEISQSLQLDLTKYEDRLLGSSWCSNKLDSNIFSTGFWVYSTANMPNNCSD